MNANYERTAHRSNCATLGVKYYEYGYLAVEGYGKGALCLFVCSCCFVVVLFFFSKIHHIIIITTYTYLIVFLVNRSLLLFLSLVFVQQTMNNGLLMCPIARQTRYLLPIWIWMWHRLLLKCVVQRLKWCRKRCCIEGRKKCLQVAYSARNFAQPFN